MRHGREVAEGHGKGAVCEGRMGDEKGRVNRENGERELVRAGAEPENKHTHTRGKDNKHRSTFRSQQACPRWWGGAGERQRKERNIF